MERSYLSQTMDDSVRLRIEFSALEERSADLDAKRDDLLHKSLALSTTALTTGMIKRKRIKRQHDKTHIAYVETCQAASDAMHEMFAFKHEVWKHQYENQDIYFNAAIIEASKDGVNIVTEDTDALVKATWQQDHIPEGGHIYSPIEHLTIADISTEELEANLHSYPEMSWDIPEEEILRAKELYLSIPLTHATESRPLIEAICDKRIDTGILCHKQLDDANVLSTSYSDDGIKGFSFDTDKAMGLDNYVFMCSGPAYTRKVHDELASVIMINPAIQLDDACIVTPNDLLRQTSVNSSSGIESDTHVKEFQDYRASMVSGRGWVELMARRIAKFSENNPGMQYPVDSAFTFGEIKYRGEVPVSAILKVLKSDEAIDTYYDELRMTLDLRL